tara:strand:- start:245 stop:1339 length:1095 start_codon:yes stop_codon:yes gene_type:complete
MKNRPFLLIAALFCGILSSLFAQQVREVPPRGPIKIQPAPRPLPGRGPIQVRPGGQAPQKASVNWAQQQLVFIGTLDTVLAGPVGRSFPPMFTHKLNFTVKEVIRGNLKPGDKIEASHVARQRVAPVFPLKASCIVGAEKSRGSYRVSAVEKVDPKNIASIRLSCVLPLGWTSQGGKVLSPWSGLKGKWPASQKEGATHFCAMTGRPALMVGSGASFSVEKVPPQVAIKWTNPDGDGEYKVTLSNPSKAPVTIPALRKMGNKILWEESLVVLCQGKPYPAPGASGILGVSSPVTLNPGQTVSGIVNPLALEGPQWPRGGYRITFQVCLGEMSSSQSFYYMSKHHDKIRGLLKAGKPIRSPDLGD